MVLFGADERWRVWNVLFGADERWRVSVVLLGEDERWRVWIFLQEDEVWEGENCQCTIREEGSLYKLT